MAKLLLSSAHESNPSYPTLVHLICIVLAAGHCTDFYPANYLADSIAVPNNWVHHGGSFQTYRRDFDLAFPIDKGDLIARLQRHQVNLVPSVSAIDCLAPIAYQYHRTPIKWMREFRITG